MKQYFIIGLIAIFICGCSKKEDTNQCPTPRIGASAFGSNVDVEVDLDNFTYGFVEIEYGANGFSKGSGTILTTSSNSQLTNLPNGTYDIYGRGNCGGAEWSDWAGPTSFIVSASVCPAPTNLRTLYDGYYNSLYWDDVNDVGNIYEYEYGIAGFSLGSGTRVQTGWKDGTAQNVLSQTYYDFYVRAYCLNTWSAWSGPKRFLTN